jgi:hypothetical protein
MTIRGLGGLDWSQIASQVAQKRTAGQNSVAGSTTDTSEISPRGQNVAAMVAAANQPGGSWAGYNTLTAADKKLVKNVTGWDINADPYGKTASTEAFELAGRLNLDRFSGDSGDSENGLVGEVDQAYISKLIKAETNGQDIMPLSLLYKVQSYLATQPNGTAQA